MAYRWVKDETNARILYCDGDRIAIIPPPASSVIMHHDELTAVEEGVFRWTRRFRLPQPVPLESLHLMMEVIADYPPRYCLIPGVSYNGNHWGTGQEPKGFRRDGAPWSFAWHRTAVPGATYSEGSAWSVALFGDAPPMNTGFSCALIPEADQVIHRLLWPEEEGPVVYSRVDGYSPAYTASLILSPGQELVAGAYIVVHPVTNARTAWFKLLDTAWARNYHEPTSWFSPEEIWRLGVRYAKESLWTEKEAFRGFSSGLVRTGDSWQQRPASAYEIGWCGQNISLANALLYDYLRTNDPSSRTMGIAVLDSWVSHARLDNGLVRCHIDDPRAAGQHTLYTNNTSGSPLQTDPVEIQDACNLGGAAVSFFEAAHLAALCGMDRPSYADTARGICDFIVHNQSSSGQIGRAWMNDGTCIDREGTIGCFLVPALISAYRHTRQRRYLDAAERGYAYYLSGLLDDGFTTAGALDTHCIDKESAVPLLSAGLALHEITHRATYLVWAEHVGQYLATWQWHHTVPFPSGSPLAALGYDTFGGTSVSTQHHHLDPYAIAVVPGWLRLAELTGRTIWRERAIAAWAHGTIGISNGSLVVMHRQRPAGSQDEGAFHTRWQHTGSVSQWLVAWPTAFRLEVLRVLRDWTVLPRRSVGAGDFHRSDETGG